jgi:hypothetical protein
VLLPEKRVQHFTPPPAFVVGLSYLLTRGQSLQAEAPRGKETRPLPSLFYGNGGTKFLLLRDTRMMTTPAKPASVTAICAALLRASPGSIGPQFTGSS